MFTTIRKHQRWLMLVIAFLTIVAFAFLYNTTDMDRVGSNMIAKIYGRDVMQVDIERAVRNYQLSLALGQFQLVRDLAGQAQTEDEAASNFIWNLLVLQHEAAALGLEPSAAAVVDRIKTLPVFQTDGVFDPVKYSQFLQEQLAPRGFTERQLESVIKDTLRLEAVKQLVESPAMVLPDELMPVLQRSAPSDVMVVKFDATEIGKDVTVPEEEVQRAFDDRKAKLQMPERRSVNYVTFVLGADQRELKDDARVAALQKLATTTGEFSDALGQSGRPLADVAREKGLEPATSPMFGPDGLTGGPLEGVAGEVVPAAAKVAFRLPAAPGNFEIVQLAEDGYAVVEVAEISPARPMKFDEARPDLKADLIAQKRDEAVRTAAARAVEQIRTELAAGKTFPEAAKAAGVTFREFRSLNLFSENLTPDERQIALSVMNLEPGTLGAFTDTPTGGFLPFLASRAPLDEQFIAERKPVLEQGMRQGRQMLLFAQWLTTARNQAGLQMLRPL
jgi:peptidyl-prolyl cis-trans isomerase D